MCSNRRGTQCIPARHDASSTRSSLFHLKNRHLVFGEFLAAALKFLADACIGDRQTFDPDFSINSECLPPVNVTRRCHSAADMRHASLALAWHLSVSLLEDRACHLPITSSLLSSVHSDQRQLCPASTPAKPQRHAPARSRRQRRCRDNNGNQLHAKTEHLVLKQRTRQQLARTPSIPLCWAAHGSKSHLGKVRGPKILACLSFKQQLICFFWCFTGIFAHIHVGILAIPFISFFMLQLYRTSLQGHSHLISEQSCMHK